MAAPGMAWSPQQLVQMHLGFAPGRVVKTALELNVFSNMAEGKSTVAELAQAAGASERGMRMVLDALGGMGLLSKNAHAYHLTEIARQFLVRGSPAYMGDYLTVNQIWESWGHLTESVRTGRPYRAVENQSVAEEFFPQLVRGLHVMNAEPARRAARALGVGTRRHGVRALDVACGSGIWGIAVAEADPEAHITAQDYPGVLVTTCEYLMRHHVESRYDFLPGELKTIDLGESRFDVALLGNIVHSEGEIASRDLFRRVFRALRPGGEIAIADMIPDDDRTGPEFQLMFALNMLVNTEMGDTYTFAEYKRWLTETGFARVEAVDIESHSPLVIARKV